MGELLLQYLKSLYKDAPVGVYIVLTSFFCVCGAVILWHNEIRESWRQLSGLLLTEYLIVIYCTTVIFRPFKEDQKHDFTPFWSYKAMLQEWKPDLIAESIMNIVVFVPLGLLLGMAFRHMKLWGVVLFGLCISLSIEALQYFLKRGFAEVDDMMHNTLGCVIGYLGALLVAKLCNSVQYGTSEKSTDGCRLMVNIWFMAKYPRF